MTLLKKIIFKFNDVRTRPCHLLTDSKGLFYIILDACAYFGMAEISNTDAMTIQLLQEYKQDTSGRWHDQKITHIFKDYDAMQERIKGLVEVHTR